MSVDDDNAWIMFLQRSHGEDEGSGSGSEGSHDDDYVPYVPVKIRKQQMVSGGSWVTACLSYCPLDSGVSSDSVKEENSFVDEANVFIPVVKCF